jgi:hypothetical protein
MSAFVLFAVFGFSKVTAKAAQTSYIDADGVEQTVDATEIGTEIPTGGLTAGWWVLNQNITTSAAVSVTGDVHLILGNGCTLSTDMGVFLTDINTNLTIYAQTLDTSAAGAIYSSAHTPGAAIGSTIGGDCGNITINGGVITAISESNMGTQVGIGPGAAIGSGAGGTCGKITINAGEVRANVTYDSASKTYVASTAYITGAGIGAGYKNAREGYCETIEINGGTVYAKSCDGAAIGNGAGNSRCGLININGGVIHAQSQKGAAIGSGEASLGFGAIEIHGGLVEARIASYAGDYSNAGAAIGGGKSSSCGSIRIEGGQISAYSVDGGLATNNITGIGAGNYGTLPSSSVIMIGYNHPEDYIEACSYQNGAIIMGGCSFKVDGGSTITSLSQAAGKKIVPAAPSLANCSVTLSSGVLGLNFYMDLPGNISDYENSYMQFTVNPCSTYERTPANDTFDPSCTITTGGKTYYGYTCYVQISEMADTVCATFHNGDDDYKAEYSVKQYINSYIKSKGGLNNAITTTEGKLVASLGDFGHFTQQMLKTTKSWGENDHNMMPVVWESSPKDKAWSNLDKYAMVRDVTGSGIKSATMSIVTDEDTAIKFYLTKESGATPGEIVVTKGTTVLVAGTDYTVETSGNRIVIRISGIKAQDMGVTYDISVGGTTIIKDASVISYVQAIMNASAYASNEEALNAAMALAWYYNYADLYRKQ